MDVNISIYQVTMFAKLIYFCSPDFQVCRGSVFPGEGSADIDTWYLVVSVWPAISLHQSYDWYTSCFVM